MKPARPLTLTLRSQVLTRDKLTREAWKTVTKKAKLVPAETALLLCDVWDKHTQRGAEERLGAMVPRMNRVVKKLRRLGVLIIHSPSDVIDRYKDTQARKNVLAAPPVTPKEVPHDDPPMPWDKDTSTVSDTLEPKWQGPGYPWTREHAGIEIKDEDAISAKGLEVYSLMQARGIKHLLIMGVHTNCCILHRSFGIKQMVKWGVDIALIRDLTDGIYSPSKPPYVSHDEGTALVIGYIEKFWCPTVLSGELLRK